jgi:hypothetical protein
MPRAIIKLLQENRRANTNKIRKQRRRPKTLKSELIKNRKRNRMIAGKRKPKVKIK